MAATLKTSKQQYSRYYGNLRGVDFASDHTNVDDNRLAFAVNMYRDYSSGEGESLETIPGFRRIIDTGEKIYGIHEYTYKADGETVHKLLVHAGNTMYDVNEEAGTNTAITITSGQTTINMNAAKSTSFYFNNLLYIIDGKNYLKYDGTSLTDAAYDHTYVPTTFRNIIPGGANADTGKEYEQRNLLSPFFKNTFVGDGVGIDGTVDYYLSEQDLEDYVKVVVYGDTYIKNTGDFPSDPYDPEHPIGNMNSYWFDPQDGHVRFALPPQKPEITTNRSSGSSLIRYPAGYAGIEIEVRKTVKKVTGIAETELANSNLIIKECTIATVFDGRVFFSGNPLYPNHVFYSGRNDTGYADPTYWGILNYFQDGITTSHITGMLPVSDTLAVIKSDSQQEGSIFYHKPQTTDIDVLPVIYPSTNGSAGIGGLGACKVFIDDPVFVSHNGLESVGMLSQSYERSIYHRSSLVDPMLTKADLQSAVMEIWNGYLCILVDGNMFLADSRQTFNHQGAKQYEWYYIEGIGVWKNQYEAFIYADNPGFPDGMSVTLDSEQYTLTYNKKYAGQLANEPNTDEGQQHGMASRIVESNSIVIDDKEYTVYFTVENGEAYYCVPRGDMIGGTVFQKAVCLKTIGKDLYFGTENGTLCKFNFDKRTEYGDIPAEYYSFDGRTIFCCAATKMDNCGIPGLTKSTQKKSTVIKTRSMNRSAAKIKIRTNRKPYTQIARINSSRFAFDNLDFSDFSFNTMEQSLFAVKEKEKKWVEKQYFIYSDEFCKPFSLHYITYRYFVAGKYKNK